MRQTHTPNSVENMSEDDNIDNIDIEESDEDDSDPKQGRKDGTQFYSQAEKRAHHNALERKRRDHIKDSFTSLRDSVPSLQGEKASRAQILKKAAEYIQFMRRKNNSHQQDIDDLKRQNSMLEAQSTSLLRTLERARGNFDGEPPVNGDDIKSETEESEDEDVPQNVRRSKKIKTNAY